MYPAFKMPILGACITRITSIKAKTLVERNGTFPGLILDVESLKAVSQNKTSGPRVWGAISKDYLGCLGVSVTLKTARISLGIQVYKEGLHWAQKPVDILPTLGYFGSWPKP